MDVVYIVHHVHVSQDGEEEDVKLIGVYRARSDADAAVARVRPKPGFREHPDGFEVTEYELNKDEWTEGFISWREAAELDDEEGEPLKAEGTFQNRETNVSDDEVARAILLEIRSMLTGGWSVAAEGRLLVVSGPDAPDFVSEVWRIAQFVAYDDHVSIERRAGPSKQYRIVSRSRSGLEFEVAIMAKE